MGEDELEQQEGLAADVRRFDAIQRALSAPELAAVRESTEPMATYLELQERSPVLRMSDGTVVLLKMEDIRFVSKHQGVEQAFKFLGTDRPGIPIGIDGPEHVKYRRLLDPVFAPKRMSALASRVGELAHHLIDDFVQSGSVDAYKAWCEPLPSSMFLAIMGLPQEDLDKFLHFKALALSMSDADAERLSLEERLKLRQDATRWIRDYFNSDLDRRERQGVAGDDVLGWLVTTEVEGQRLSRQDLLDIIGFLMIAGLDTVSASLGCFLSYLARYPEQKARLIADPSSWPSAVEELLRYESPVTSGGRMTTVDLDLPSGVHLEAGTLIALQWHSANLDPDLFPEPLNVDLQRPRNPHIAFGSGWHRCLGSHLARMEMVAALEAWHSRIPDYAIKPGVELVYTPITRTPRQLPLVWTVKEQ